MIILICAVIGTVLLVLTFLWADPNGPHFNKGLACVILYAIMLAVLTESTPRAFASLAFLIGITPMITVLLVEEQLRKWRQTKRLLQMQMVGPMPTHEQITEPYEA